MRNKKRERCGAKRCNTPPSDRLKREELLDQLIYWTFSSVLIPLIRSVFYVTECETRSFKVFYFRKPVWARFRAASLQRLVSTLYQRVSYQEACSSSSPLPSPALKHTTTMGGAGAGARAGARTGARGDVPLPFLGVCGARLLPKPNGVRPITNLSER
ncbi:unnamed protein product, partial [Discosporangium mesarthrocarpum]